MAAEVHSYDVNEQFEFSSKFKKNIFIIGIIGFVLFVIGCIMAATGGGHGEEHAQMLDEVAKQSGTAMAGGGEHSYSWLSRLKTNLWINNVYFTGLAIAGLFFFAIQYVAMAGWSVAFLRIFKAFSGFLPVAAILMFGVFAWELVDHSLFHWLDHSLYEEGTATYDSIIDGKQSFFFNPFSDHAGFPIFYVIRMVLFLGGWILFSMWMGKQHFAEDLEGGTKRYRKLVRISAGFIVFFGISSSASAWDWVLSIDTHWFSTMFGWYVFASWFVAGLAGMTFLISVLKDAGYLKIVNENHLHDMAKFVFAFSIFWTYIWLSQFLLIYYANIPEEGIYFLERLTSDYYGKIIFINLFLNFAFPFLALMTRNAKRKTIILKIVCLVVLIGHWSDFYLMITPGTLKEHGTFGFLEIGTALMYTALFAFVVLSSLAKKPLIAKNHPMIEECVYHTT